MSDLVAVIAADNSTTTTTTTTTANNLADQTKRKTRGPKRKDGKTSSPSLERLDLSQPSPSTRNSLPSKLGAFFDSVGLTGSLEVQANTYMQLAKENGPEWVKQTISEHVRQLIHRYYDRKTKPGTVGNYIAVLKAFFVANEDEIDTTSIKWKKLTKALPRRRAKANDRAPTIDEIRKLVEYPDRRIKPIVYVMCSTGIRVGSWEYAGWKHVTPITNEKNGEIVAAKLIAYEHDFDGISQYTTFMTPDAYHALKEWMDFRKREGEEITGESPLMRDLWKTTNVTRAANRSFATNPKRLGESGITKLLNKAWRAQGIRDFLPVGKTRHEFKESHGFVKYHDTHTNLVMTPLYSELLRGHDVGLPGHYMRPTEQQLLTEYLKSVPLLTINDIDKSTLEKLTEKAEAAERTNEVIERMRKDIEFLKEHAFASQQQADMWENLMQQKRPLKEYVDYMYEGGMIEDPSSADPERYKFLIEGERQRAKDREKYMETLEAHGKRRHEELEENWQRWKQQQQEREKRLNPKEQQPQS